MALGLSTTVRNAILDAIRDAIDSGAGAGLLRIYDGTRPATGGAATTLLAEMTFTDPSAPNASNGLSTYSAINADPSANASGTASWYRAVNSSGTFVVDGSVTATGGGGDLTLATTTVTSGVQVSVTSFTYTAPNA